MTAKPGSHEVTDGPAPGAAAPDGKELDVMASDGAVSGAAAPGVVVSDGTASDVTAARPRCRPFWAAASIPSHVGHLRLARCRRSAPLVSKVLCRRRTKP